MTFVPILRRELLVAARRTATYRGRVILGGLAGATVVLMLLVLPANQISGPTLFRVLAYGGFLLCALEGMRATADSISQERREGTLGLLLLTGLNGRQVVLGKIISACVRSFTTVLAVAPAFALPILIGGVSGGECARVLLAFVAVLLVAQTLGALVSAFVTSSLAAFLATFAGLCLVLLLPLTLVLLPNGVGKDWTWLAGPTVMIGAAPDLAYGASPSLFWLATATGLAEAAVFLVAAGWVLERHPNLEVSEVETWWQRLLRPASGRAATWGGVSRGLEPAVWLAERTLPGQRVLWILVAVGAVVNLLIGLFAGRAAVPLMLMSEIFFAYFLKLWVAAVAPLSLNASRRAGSLELLLCTPLTPKELVRGQVDALYGYFIGPAIALVAAFPIFGIGGLALAGETGRVGDSSAFFGLGMFWFILFVLDLHALAYAGLWFGLINPRLDRAVTKTFFTVIILPWITLLVPLLGLIGMIGWPVFWMNWASRRLEKRFRDESAASFHVEGGDKGWWPWSSGSSQV